MTVFSDDPLAVARKWADEGARWLHVVDLDGAFGEESSNLTVVEHMAREIGVPIQFGGGVRSLTAVEAVLSLGVRRVVLGTAAVTDTALVAQAIARYGESITVGLDVKNDRVAIQGWQEDTAVEAIELAWSLRQWGLTRVIYTNITRDGTLSGVDHVGIKNMLERTGLRLIASGGIASLDDLLCLKELEPYGLEGAIVGLALYTGAIKLKEAIESVG